MTTNPTDSACPKCGAPIPEDAPQGLCPKCVLEGAATRPDPTTSPASRTPPPSVEEIAAHFPELEVIELIGAGGMGAVYKARQPKLERFVALKILSHDLSEDPAFAERFNREARVLARLNHPNIVTVFDFGTAGPHCYLLMEFVDGVNLRQAMRAGGFSPVDTLALVQDICAALKFAHEERILHRDIKPENVLIDSRGRVKIADFGIAKLVGDDEPEQITLTMRGAVLGSPQYMAPEQIESPGDVDQRADIYSLGVVFYELLTGELPLGRFSLPSEKSPVDARIDEIVMRTLEKEREARFQSAGEVGTQVEALTRLQAEPGIGATPAPAPEPLSKEPETARFAGASAILTGVSLLLAGVVLVILSLVIMQARASTTAVNPDASVLLAVFLAAGLLIVGVPAFLGILFGAKALGEIRHSGGRKGGFGSAMFGTLAWPVILVIGLTGAVVQFSLAMTEDGGVSAVPLTYIAATVGSLALFLMIRTVWRWAQSGERRAYSDGEAGAGASSGWMLALQALVVIVVAIVGLQGILSLLTPSPRVGENPDPGRPALGPEATGSQVASSSSSREPFEVTWHDMDGPDVSYYFTLPPGKAATFDLLRIDPSGKIVRSNLLNWSAVASDTEPFEGAIGLGVTRRKLDSQGPFMDVRATIENLKGGPNDTLQLGTAFGIGNVNFDGGGMNTLSEDGQKKLEVGQFIPGKDPLTGAKQKLFLVVETQPRPGPGSPFVLKDKLLDSDQPSNMIRNWMKANAPEMVPAADAEGTDIRWSKSKPEIELDFVAPADRLTIFGLREGWDPEQEGPDDWYVVAAKDKDLKGTIRIGTVGRPMVDGVKHTKVAATLQDAEGKWVKVHTATVPGEQDVSLPPDYPVFDVESPSPQAEIKGVITQDLSGGLDLTRPGMHSLFVSTRAGSQLDVGLALIAWSVPRPGSAPAPGEERIGSVSPRDFVDNWVLRRLEWLRTQKRDPSEADPVVSVGEIEGIVRLRSGMFFDTRERPIAGKTEILRGEMLFLRKDSKATVYLDRETPVRLGPQSEDAALVIPVDPSSWYLTPLSGLRVRLDRLKPESELEINTPWNSKLTVRGPAAFQIDSSGQLQVWNGEVEVFEQSDGKTTVVKTGQGFAHPTPADPGKTDPKIDRAIEEYLETTKKLNSLLERVTDEETARKVAPEALGLADKWVVQDQALEDASTDSSSFQKHGRELKKHIGALQSTREKLRRNPEMGKPLEKVLERIGTIVEPTTTAPESQELRPETPRRIEKD